jgi:voltage-gated potassium channel
MKNAKKRGFAWKKPSSELALLFSLLLVAWTVGTVFYHVVEDLSIVDALYFTAVTLTTVGYGDFSPQTHAGKLFTSVFVFLGIAIFLAFAATLFNVVASRIRRN